MAMTYGFRQRFCPEAARRRVRIYRRDPDAGRPAPFQREWEPAFCPEARASGAIRRSDEMCTNKSWRIPRRYYAIVSSTALTLASTAIVSFGVTVRNVGLTFDTGLIWLAAWPVSAMIAVPLRMVLTPLINRCIDPLVEPPLPQQ